MTWALLDELVAEREALRAALERLNDDQVELELARAGALQLGVIGVAVAWAATAPRRPYMADFDAGLRRLGLTLTSLHPLPREDPELGRAVDGLKRANRLNARMMEELEELLGERDALRGSLQLGVIGVAVAWALSLLPPPFDRTCTCLGSCRGPERLGRGWRCALAPAEKDPF